MSHLAYLAEQVVQVNKSGARIQVGHVYGAACLFRFGLIKSAGEIRIGRELEFAQLRIDGFNVGDGVVGGVHDAVYDVVRPGDAVGYERYVRIGGWTVFERVLFVGYANV